MLYKDAAGTLEVAEDGGRVCGYASTFDRERDAYGDVVAKGAFAKTLERWKGIGKPIPLLYGHNTSDPKYNIGCVTEAREDERGLYVEAEFDAESEVAQDVRHLVKTGRLYQFSFA
ncbi:MAG: HK97 family phage prohead protease, partial [Atopobiaceae bacterium]|nr:HK97 family phage prohead protease [Atopobiaceae bacterium]